MEKKRDGNIYDKIVKENIESIIPALMNSVLGFKVLESVVIKEKLQQTKEKEADVLRIITDPSNRKFILHLEFQVDDYKKMVYRMIDYWGLLKSKYHLSVRQYVIYSTNPEEIILAVLGDFGNENPENALTQIIKRLQETKTDQTTLQKHFRQLRILAKLRKLDLKFDDMIQNMAKYLDVENDYFFIKGQETEQTKFVKNLLQKLDLTTKQTADIAGVSEDFVESVQRQLTDK